GGSDLTSPPGSDEPDKLNRASPQNYDVQWGLCKSAPVMCAVLDPGLKPGEYEPVSPAQFAEIVNDHSLMAHWADKTLTPAVIGRLSQLPAYRVGNWAS